MTWKNDMNDAIARHIERNTGKKNVQVISMTTDTEIYGGGCETCCYDQEVVKVQFVWTDENGNARNGEYEYEGDFGAFIRDLTD